MAISSKAAIFLSGDGTLEVRGYISSAQDMVFIERAVEALKRLLPGY